MPGKPLRNGKRAQVLERLARGDHMTEPELREASFLWPRDQMQAAITKCNGNYRDAIVLMGAPNLSMRFSGDQQRKFLADPTVRKMMLERFTDPEAGKRRVVARLLNRALHGRVDDEAFRAIDLLARLNGWYAPTTSKNFNLNANGSDLAAVMRGLQETVHEPGAALAVDVELHG